MLLRILLAGIMSALSRRYSKVGSPTFFAPRGVFFCGRTGTPFQTISGNLKNMLNSGAGFAPAADVPSAVVRYVLVKVFYLNASHVIYDSHFYCLICFAA